MNNATGENNPKTRNAWLKQSLVIGLTFWLGVVPGIGVAQPHGPRTFVAHALGAYQRQSHGPQARGPVREQYPKGRNYVVSPLNGPAYERIQNGLKVVFLAPGELRQALA